MKACSGSPLLKKAEFLLSILSGIPSEGDITTLEDHEGILKLRASLRPRDEVFLLAIKPIRSIKEVDRQTESVKLELSVYVGKT